MHYDDQTRRVNYAVGAAIGLILGTGLALIASPKRRLRKPRRIRDSVHRLEAVTRSRSSALRSAAAGASDSLSRTFAALEID